MNKQRRNKISEIVQSLKATAEQLENVKSEEEYCFDNMPENLQYSMRGENSQEAIELLDEALENLEEVIDSLEGVL